MQLITKKHLSLDCLGLFLRNMTFYTLSIFGAGPNSQKTLLEEEVALPALKHKDLTLYDNLRELEQQGDELLEEKTLGDLNKTE